MLDAHTINPAPFLWGHICLALCAVLYLAWWWIFFNPGMPKPVGALYAAGVACISLAALLGVGAIVLLGSGLAAASAVGAVPGWTIAAGAAAVYLALALVTSRLFARPLTSELLLFVLWAALELAVVNALFGSGLLGAAAAFLLAGGTALIFVGCLACYLLYFKLAPPASFFDGALPLAAVGLYAAASAALIARL